jgi:hypothetical protein
MIPMEEGHNAGLRHAGLNVVTEPAQLFGDDLGGALLLECQLGVPMEVTSPRNELFAKGLGLGS